MVSADPSDELLYTAFKTVFPLKDGSELLARRSVIIDAAMEHLSTTGIPRNITQFCAMDEAEIMVVFMKATLGNLVMSDEIADAFQPYLADPTTGKLVYVDDFTNNRLLIFQVLVFSLLIALARTWYILHGYERENRLKAM
eukprot:867963-Rhodomonas_salina.2